MSDALHQDVVEFMEVNEESECKITQFAMGLMGYKYTNPVNDCANYDFFGIFMREFLAIKNAKKNLPFLGTVETLGVVEKMFRYDIQGQSGYKEYELLIEAIAGTDIIYPEVYNVYDWAKAMKKKGYYSVIFNIIIACYKHADRTGNFDTYYAFEELQRLYGDDVPKKEFSQTAEEYVVFVLTKIWDKYKIYKKYKKHK